MDAIQLNAVHTQLESLMEEKLPCWVVRRINNLIPKKDNSGQDVYIYINAIHTSGELISSLTLLDKKYESRMHQYGSKEELLFAYRDIKPGLILNHRVRDPINGRFVQSNNRFEPVKSNEASNVFLIKETEWNNYKYDGIKESYTILVYNHNDAIEEARKKNIDEVVEKLQKEYVNTMGGSSNDSTESNNA